MSGTTFQFLSTLSLRRATSQCRTFASGIYDFYPRSPCGERHGGCIMKILVACISIHALLAESDCKALDGAVTLQYISIHALLAESDWSPKARPPNGRDFYPRSPCGERPNTNLLILEASAFLSTLSLRRATAADMS